MKTRTRTRVEAAAKFDIKAFLKACGVKFTSVDHWDSLESGGHTETWLVKTSKVLSPKEAEKFAKSIQDALEKQYRLLFGAAAVVSVSKTPVFQTQVSSPMGDAFWYVNPDVQEDIDSIDDLDPEDTRKGVILFVSPVSLG